MSNQATSSAAQVAAPLVLTRVLDAPRALVWRCWTEPERLARWFGPHHVRNPVVELDARPGGILRWAMQTDTGETFHHEGRFQEVREPERLSFTMWFTDEAGNRSGHSMFPDWPADVVFLTTVTLEEREGRTTMTVHQVITPESVAAHPVFRTERRMARDGWTQSFERLDALLAQR